MQKFQSRFTQFLILVESSNKESRNELVEITKAAILCTNIDCLDILAFCIFDQIPMYFLPTIIKNITWLSSEKKIYDLNLKS